MSKYKVGDKFIIEIAEVYENVLNDIDVFEAVTSEPLYRIKGFNSLVFDPRIFHCSCAHLFCPGYLYGDCF